MGFFTEEIAIDLGTANTLIIHNDKVVINSEFCHQLQCQY